jgi:hypothetical protein
MGFMNRLLIVAILIISTLPLYAQTPAWRARLLNSPKEGTRSAASGMGGQP